MTLMLHGGSMWRARVDHGSSARTHTVADAIPAPQLGMRTPSDPTRTTPAPCRISESRAARGLHGRSGAAMLDVGCAWLARRVLATQGAMLACELVTSRRTEPGWPRPPPPRPPTLGRHDMERASQAPRHMVAQDRAAWRDLEPKSHCSCDLLRATGRDRPPAGRHMLVKSEA